MRKAKGSANLAADLAAVVFGNTEGAHARGGSRSVSDGPARNAAPGFGGRQIVQSPVAIGLAQGPGSQCYRPQKSLRYERFIGERGTFPFAGAPHDRLVAPADRRECERHRHIKVGGVDWCRMPRRIAAFGEFGGPEE